MLKSTCTCPFQYAEKRALEHKHKLDNTRTRPRGAVEHEHEHESTATSIRAQVRAVSRILNDMRNPSGILVTCTWVCMGLEGSTCSESLPVVTCDFEPPEHVPWTSASAHTCAMVFGRAPCVPRSREQEKRPAAGREKMPMCIK